MILQASCQPGLEPALAPELEALGLSSRPEAPGLLRFEGGLLDGARACLHLRVATTVRAVILQAEVGGRAALLRALKGGDLGRWIPPGTAVDARATIRGSWLRHTGALVDSLSEALPGIGLRKEGVGLLLRLEGKHLMVSLDLAGDSLHLRGWRREGGRAPLRETLACGLLALAGWKPGEPLLDPMCGSGTIAIEAARWALGIAPGVDRRFAVEALLAFAQQAEAFAAERTRARGGKEAGALLAASDAHRGAVGSTTRNAKRAGVVPVLTVAHATLPAIERPEGPPGLVICNAPYGRRVGEDRAEVLASHAAIGEALQGPLAGWRLALLTRDDALAAATGLKLRRAAALKNGGLSVGLYLGR